jgi:hypothetical protein
MKTMRPACFGIAAAAVAAVLLLGPAGASAYSQLIDVRDSCTDINCGAMKIRGMSQTDEPFVIQVYADFGECLRIDVTKQGKDAELLVINPNINVSMYNDDRDAADDRPLVVIDPVEYTGWHSILVGYWEASRKPTKFFLKYGRYDSGNPNCQAVTGQVRIENDMAGK